MTDPEPARPATTAEHGDTAATASPSASNEGPAEPELLRAGRYAVIGVLGEGTQGETLRAVDKKNGRLVAIKRFRIRGAKSWKDVELAEREAQVLEKLDHPALPHHVEHFEERGCLYLVMQHIEGEPLSERSYKRGQDEVIRFLNDMAVILDYLHSRSPPIVHRDIKPRNVLRRPDGSHALVDFGSVRDHLKPEGGSTVVGTFGYMAPEQFQGRALPASDVYAVGATALSLLTGRSPDLLPHRGLALDVNAALAGQTSPSLIALLSAMLEPDPDRRAPNLRALLFQHGLLGKQRPQQTPSNPGGRARASSSQRRSRHTKTGHHSRRASPRHRHGGLAWLGNPFLLAFVLFHLWFARLCVWLLFETVLPFVLMLASMFVGPSARRASRHSVQLGMRGRSAIRQAESAILQRADQAAAGRHAERESRRVRVRVSASETRDERSDVGWAEEAAEEAHAAAAHRSSTR